MKAVTECSRLEYWDQLTPKELGSGAYNLTVYHRQTAAWRGADDAVAKPEMRYRPAQLSHMPRKELAATFVVGANVQPDGMHPPADTILDHQGREGPSGLC